MNLHLTGIHAILKSGNKLSYVVYNLSTGRYVQDCYIPSDISSFLGLQPQNINLTSAGEVRRIQYLQAKRTERWIIFIVCISLQKNKKSTCIFQNIECSMILRDGNNTIYPIAKDCADAIRDPNWLDLVPVNCIGAATIPIPICSSNLKNQVAVIALAFDNLLLMPRILRCDYESVKQVFCNLEQDLSKYGLLCEYNFIIAILSA